MTETRPSEPSGTDYMPVVADPGVARRVTRSLDFDVVDLPGYYLSMAETTGMDLRALIRIAASIPFFASGKRHLFLRRVLADVFKPNRIAGWQPIVAEEVDAALARIANEPSVDLVSDFADSLFSDMMTRLFGLPPQRSDEFSRWAGKLRFVSELMMPIRRVRQLNEAAEQFLDAIRVRDEKMRGLRNASLAARIERSAGPDMPPADVDALIAALYIAGQTTAHTLANILLIVLRLDPTRRPLPQDPITRKNAIGDLIRRGGAPQYLLRIVQTPQVLEGRELEPGDPALIHIPSANRIEAIANAPGGCPFGHGARINEHFSFGAGIHHCSGAPLARMMIATALDGLLTAFPAIELMETEPALFGTDIIKSPRSLPVHLNAKKSSRNSQDFGRFEQGD